MAEVEKTLNNVESTVRIDPEELNQEIETAEQEEAKAGEPVDKLWRTKNYYPQAVLYELKLWESLIRQKSFKQHGSRNS